MASKPIPPRRPLVTGSQAYGTPREDSDIDLVILVDETTLQMLSAFCDSIKRNTKNADSDGGHVNGSFMFGKLNLVCTTDPVAYDVWRQGTETLKAMRPVTRDQAKAHFRSLREKAKLPKDGC